ncbi:pyridoxal phosphate-dependent aminotransferase [Cellulomonas marina]|uniref:Aminotransferase n=1 Tax=Cellulomonas marina TaxID=988821 RepID=A0A1I0WV13_9CELL|nr:aminotransferase class I/II-fold pyridoxal phosphate-dependent enzyme [Cellulomonas marina]GIG30318.1 aminotransferase [Cellulomonas marina]SFA91783.1 aspartate aminotransferase [Cellulomonas marina]
MPRLAPHAATIPGSQIRLVTERAWRTPGAVVLSVGEPSAPTAPHVLAAAADALARDDTGYTPNAGIRPLREALAADLSSSHGRPVEADRVWITAGGAQALHLGLTLTLSPGDEVLVPDPGYPPFAMTAHLLDARPVRYRLDPGDGFLPDPAVVEAAVTSRTRVLLLNSPSNPLGTVLPADRTAALLDVARRHDLWVLSDECYARLTFDVPHVPPAALDEDDRVLTLHSFSKTYGMTGMRVGALVVPATALPVLGSVQESVVSCVNTPAQHAALAALTGPQDGVEEARATYRRLRDVVTGVLASGGIRALPAAGGMYVWADVGDRAGGDVLGWCLRLVDEHGVALAPGTAFGSGGEGWVRISLGASEADLLTGLGRVPR